MAAEHRQRQQVDNMFAALFDKIVLCFCRKICGEGRYWWRGR